MYLFFALKNLQACNQEPEAFEPCVYLAIEYGVTNNLTLAEKFLDDAARLAAAQQKGALIVYKSLLKFIISQ